MEQDMLTGKLAEVDAQLAGVHAKLRSAAQMESAELDAAIAQTREETAQCAHALAERLRHSRAHQVGEIADAFEEIREIVRRVQTEVRRGDESGEEMPATDNEKTEKQPSKNRRTMNILNNRNKRTSIFKAVALCLIAAVSFTLVSCDDDMDIQQSYPFTVEVMPVPNKVTKGQTVEIRCELKKTGDFANTLYTIRYFQFEGEGTLKMDNGITFLPNDRYLLENEKFRLYYTAQGDEAHNFIVVVEDNFSNSYELEFDFNNRNMKDDGAISVVPIGNFKPLTR